MIRLPHVLQAVNAWQSKQIEYGTSDCCQFVAHVVEYLTGHDYSAQFQYAGRAEADALVSQHGDLSGLLTDVLEREPVPLTDLSPGDVVLLRTPGVDAAGIYLGTRKVMALDSEGAVRRFPLRWCPYGWHTWPG